MKQFVIKVKDIIPGADAYLEYYDWKTPERTALKAIQFTIERNEALIIYDEDLAREVSELMGELFCNMVNLYEIELKLTYKDSF